MTTELAPAEAVAKLRKIALEYTLATMDTKILSGLADLIESQQATVARLEGKVEWLKLKAAKHRDEIRFFTGQRYGEEYQLVKPIAITELREKAARAEAAEAERDTLRRQFEQYVRNNCKLIQRGTRDGLGCPELINGKCEGYTQSPGDDEPHDKCKICIAAYNPEAEYTAALTAPLATWPGWNGPPGTHNQAASTAPPGADATTAPDDIHDRLGLVRPENC